MKRRGPMTWLAGRSRGFWIIVCLLPAIYVLSSGPMRKIGVVVPPHSMTGHLLPNFKSSTVVRPWYQTVYGPLIWASGKQPWGMPLAFYWSIFDVRKDRFP